MSDQLKQPRRQIASPQEAVDALCARVVTVGTERVALAEANGRVLAEDLVADRPSPATDVSAMDGFALRLPDARAGAEIAVRAEALPGRAPPAMPETGAVRIMTGAPVPPGADLVLARELVDEEPERIRLSSIDASELQVGRNIRRRAENANAGETLVEAGTLITGPVSGALATFGASSPSVHSQVRVGVIVTGDEVASGDAPLPDWRLRDSNGPALCSLLGGAPWNRIVVADRAADDPAALKRAIESAVARCDALFLTGGVSAGDRDFVPAVLREIGAETVFHKLRQRPGRPLLGAVFDDRIPILGLPGNPVSVLVTARRIGVPVLQRMAGFPSAGRQPGVLVEDSDSRTLHLWWHRLVRLTESGSASLVPGRGSGDVVGAARSEGFIEVPPDRAGPGPWPFYPWTL